MSVVDQIEEWDFGDGRRKIDSGMPVLRFRVELPLYDQAVDEPRRTIDRLIEVPEDYTFWDLHVAIQSVMGWHDSHVHEFEIPGLARKPGTKIGLVDEDAPDELIDGRSIAVRLHLARIRSTGGMQYRYDFGDNWKHWITHEATVTSDGGLYPRCLAGRWACPPEDCGGDSGYFRILEIISNPKHDEYKETREWLRWIVSVRGKWPYRPERFDPKRVKFDDPAIREAFVFGG